MSLKTKVANALSFAALAGLTGAKASTEDDEDKKESAKAEDDEDKTKDGDESDKDKEAKAAGEDAKAEDEKEDDSDGDDDDRKSAKAVAAERERCKAIVAHGVKVDKVIEASTFAFDTSMSAQAAISTLDALAAASPKQFATATLHERMAGLNVPVIRPEASGDSGVPGMTSDKAAAVAETVKAINAAADKARGVTKA